MPCLPHYCIAKHGVRVFSDALRRSFALTKDNIQVVTLEATFFRTEIINKEANARDTAQLFAESSDEIKKVYKHLNVEQFSKESHKLVDLISRPNIGEVTEAMERAVTLQSPKHFYRCGGYHELVVWAIGIAPEVFLDFFSSKISVAGALVRKFGRS